MSLVPAFNNTIIQCTDDLPCPGNSQCVYQNQNSNISDGVCGCGTEWGNGGIYCDVFGATTYYKIVFHSILALLFTIIAYLVIVDLSRLHKNKKLTRLDVKATAMIECAIGCIASIVFNICTIVIVVNPNAVQLTLDQTFGYWKVSKYVISQQILSTVLTFFIAAAILNICALWLEVAIASKRFRKLRNPQISKNFVLFVIIIDVIVAITMIVIFTLSPSISGQALVPVMVLVAFGCAYSAYSISIVINQQESSEAEGVRVRVATNTTATEIERDPMDPRIRESLRRIRLCATIIVAVMIIIMIISTLINLVGNKLKRVYTPPNVVSSPALMISVTYLCQIAMFFTIYWYIHGSMKNENGKADIKMTSTLATAVANAHDSSNVQAKTPLSQQQNMVLQDLEF